MGELIGALGLAFTTLAAAQGVTDTQVVLGQSAALSGPGAAARHRHAARRQALLRQRQRAGGVNGRKIELKTLDDGYEPTARRREHAEADRDGQGVRALRLRRHADRPAPRCRSSRRRKVPFVGPFTGAEPLRAPFNRYVFHVRASYFDETEKIVEQSSRPAEHERSPSSTRTTPTARPASRASSARWRSAT